MANHDLFGGSTPGDIESIGLNAFILRGFALPYVNVLLTAIDYIKDQSPFRHMTVRRGFTMSVAMTNCGELGWVTDQHGYRYTRIDPNNGQPWPPMPEAFSALAHKAALAVGFINFEPDSCLINHYLPNSRMALHQDKNERDFTAPIVSVSLGMTATFLFGGLARSDQAFKTPLYHGDVVVWGGNDRLRYHGVKPLSDQPHSLMGSQRINFTFRKAG